MKVHGNDRVSGPRPVEGAEPGPKGAQPPLQPSAPAGDRVEVSPAGRELAAMREAARTAPEIRVTLVESLRRRIEEGRYEPDARVIAERLLEELRAGLL